MTDFDKQAGRDTPAEPDPNATQADDVDVANSLRDLAEMVSDVDPVETVLAEIAGFAVVAVPGADGAGVTLARPGEPLPVVSTWSVTETFVRRLDQLQYEICGEGPCLTAMQTRRPLVSGSLGSDERWPRFGGRAARMQVHSALALPLLVRGAVVGAINIYARRRDVFTSHAVRLGGQFAVPAAVVVHNIAVLHAARDQVAQLQSALSTRATIDQAVGIVRSRSGGSSDEAFTRLRQLSQAENVKVAVVAQRIVDEAVRRVHARPQGK